MLNLEPCQPPAWASGGHTQTILGHLIPSPRLPSKGRLVEIPLPDGDRVTAFVNVGTSAQVVYVFHGLAGSTDSSYVHRTAALAAKRGDTTVLMNHRGCGEGLGLAKAPYHSGRGEDLSAVIAWGRAQFPNKRHVAIGFSLSGNALLLLMTGARGEVQPDAAISVNAPIHLEKCAHLLKRGLNRIYDVKFFLQCRRDVLQGAADAVHKARVPRFATLHDFDDAYTAPAGGFKNREDYYATCSTYARLEGITRPTIMLTAEDDPFVPVADYRAAKLSRHVHLHVERFGGHMGYLHRTNTPLGTRRWQDYAVSKALDAL